MRRTSYCILCLAGLFLLIMYDMPQAFSLGLACILAPLPGIVLAWKAHKRIRCSWQIPRGITRAAPSQCQLLISGPSWYIPSFFISTEELEFTTSPSSLPAACAIPLTIPPCGLFSIHKGEAWYMDPFHLCRFHMPLTALDGFVFPARIGTESQILQALSHIMTPDEKYYYGAVQYKPGDNPRLINWKMTARTDDVYVRDSEPANGTDLLIACSTPQSPDQRDTIGDTLLSAGLALLHSGKTFTLLFLSSTGPRKEIITSVDAFYTALEECIGRGLSGNVLEQAEKLIPAQSPLLYLTGESHVFIPPALHPVIWSASPCDNADMSGRNDIMTQLGGDIHA